MNFLFLKVWQCFFVFFNLNISLVSHLFQDTVTGLKLMFAADQGIGLILQYLHLRFQMVPQHIFLSVLINFSDTGLPFLDHLLYHPRLFFLLFQSLFEFFNDRIVNTLALYDFIVTSFVTLCQKFKHLDLLIDWEILLLLLLFWFCFVHVSIQL